MNPLIKKFSAWDEESHVSLTRFNSSPFLPWGLTKPYVNLYPRSIQELYSRNSILRRVTDYRTQQILGQGLSIEGRDAEFVKTKLNELGLDNNKLSQLASDLSLFSGAAMQVVLSRDKSTVLDVVPTSIPSIRAGIPNEFHDIDHYFISNDWSLVNSRGNVNVKSNSFAIPKRIDAFDTNTNLELVYEKIENPLSDYYPVPKSESVFDELTFLSDVVSFYRNYVENGMTSSAILNYPVTPSGEDNSFSDEDFKQIEAIKENLQNELSGKDNAGSIIVQMYDPSTVSAEGVGLPKFEKPIEEENPQKFIEAFEEAKQSAMTGLGVVSPDLFGIRTASGFSSQSEELITADNLSYNQDTKQLQSKLIDIINKVLSKDSVLKQRNQFEITIERDIPVDKNIDYKELVNSGILTIDEAREALGFPPIDSIKNNNNTENE